MELDIGTKYEGEIKGCETESLGVGSEEGQTIGVFVFRIDNKGQPLISIVRARQAKDWLRAEELLGSKEIVSGSVIHYNRGGVLIGLGLIRGFVPATCTRIARGQPCATYPSWACTCIWGCWGVPEQHILALHPARLPLLHRP